MSSTIPVAQERSATNNLQPLAITRLSSSSRLSVITTCEQLRALRKDWQQLEQTNQIETNLFCSFDWCMAWSETYAGEYSSRQARPQLVAGYDDEKLVFVFPLMLTRQLGINLLTWLTDPFGQYGDVLCAKGQNAKVWINAAVRLLSRLKGIDLFYLRHIRDDSIIAREARELFTDARVPEEAPYLDLTQFKTDEEYDARYTSVQRKRRKKIRKALEKFGQVTFSKLSPGTDADEAMRLAIAEKNAWLAERGRMNRVLKCPQHLQFLKTLSRNTGPVQLVLSELKAGDKPASWEIGFRHGTKHYGYITSHLNSLTDLSPGRLHMDLSQRMCLADGMEKFDLMVPNDAHKESWSSAKAITNDMFLPVSARGRIVGFVYLRTLRPLLRSLYYYLEPTALRWFNPASYRFRAKNTPVET
jgi:CelD/BcsL family acetyltransferase involved in cellulose biosynthesis